MSDRPAGQSDPKQRRRSLLWWMQEKPEHQGLTAGEIADVSGIYDHIRHGKADRCFDDLNHLANAATAPASAVRREGRPARWWPS